MDGGSATVKLSLVTLPFEILTQIVQNLHPAGLRALALVNSECRPLARHEQFKSVHLSYSPSSSALIQKLCHEGLEIYQNGIGDDRTSLGPHVRRLLVETNREWYEKRHNLNPTELRKLKKQKQNELISAAQEEFENYLRLIDIALTLGALPHLEVLDWRSARVLPKSRLVAFACSSVQYLKLDRISVEDEFAIQIPRHLQRQQWPLRGLYLDVSWWVFDLSDKKRNISTLCNSILQLCAETLETLTWIGDGQSKTEELRSFPRDDPRYNFSRLRQLRLDHIQCCDSSIIESLLGSETRVCELDISWGTDEDKVYNLFFTHRGEIRTLDRLLWHPSSRQDPTNFLRCNPQLSNVAIELPLSKNCLETEVLPVLSSSFANLTSLSLIWHDTFISTFALKQISNLRRLMKLRLTAGNRLDFHENWLVNHVMMREQLSMLRELRLFVLHCDTYHDDMYTEDDPRTAFEPDSYYGVGMLAPRNDEEHQASSFIFSRPDSYFADTMREWRIGPRQAMMRVSFEKIHRLRMIQEAIHYARIWPYLEMAYFGQLPMAITRHAESTLEALPLVEERDNDWTAWKSKFGFSENVE